ncbi:MAG: hypothetical protein V4858_02150 [Pseudomonadota bacterium]
MARHLITTAALLLGAGLGTAHAGTAFEYVKVVLEQNVQDQDAEVKFEATGGKGGLTALQVKAPDGRTVVDFKTPDSRLGIRSLVLESPEPRNDGSVQADFPAGTYTFSGRSAGGEQLEGSAVLSHALPAPTRFIHPRPDATNVAHKRLLLNWQAVHGLSAYVLVLEQEASGREIKVNLPANTTSFSVPAGFLRPGTEYKLAIGTVASGGNASFIETAFVTAGK